MSEAYTMQLTGKIPPTVWRYKARNRFEEMPELVDLQEGVPERPGEEATHFTVTYDQPGLYRLVAEGGEVRYFLSGEGRGGPQFLELTGEEMATLQSCADAGETPDQLVKHANGQGYGDRLDWISFQGFGESRSAPPPAVG